LLVLAQLAPSGMVSRGPGELVTRMRSGSVPDGYLEHLDGLHIQTTITAAELCTAGTLRTTAS
jgi:hypothetical protein